MSKFEIQTTLEALSNISLHTNGLCWKQGAASKFWKKQEITEEDIAGRTKSSVDVPVLSTVMTKNGYVTPTPVIWLDFDRLPPSFSSWDSFRDELLCLGLGYVFASPSGKAKVACLAETNYKPFKCDGSYAHNAAIALCPTELRPYLDVAGARLCFITEGMYCLNPTSPQPVHNLQEVLAEYAKESSDAFTGTLEKQYTEALPELQTEMVAGHLEAFVRAFLMFRKAEFDLPQKVLSRTFGISVPTVNRVLAALKKLGLLEVTDHSYKIGAKAKTYQFTPGTALAELHKQLINKDALPGMPGAQSLASLPGTQAGSKVHPKTVEQLRQQAPLVEGNRFNALPFWYRHMRDSGILSLDAMAEFLAQNSETPTAARQYLSKLKSLMRHDKMAA